MEQSIISAEYLSAVKAIKQAILESRYRAARHVNKEMLTLYYWVGHYVSVHSRVDAWKTNAIGVISKMLQQELPGLTGFSETNIKNMRIFYEAWSPVLNRQMSSADWDNVLDVKLLLNRQHVYFISENVPLSSGIKKPLNTILPRTYTRRKVLSSKPTLIRLSATLISNNVHCIRLKMSTCLISLILKIRNRLTRGL